MQSVGCGQNAHYAATRLFAEAIRGSTAMRPRRATSSIAEATTTQPRAPRSISGRPWYLLLHAAGAVPRTSNAHLGYPAAMLGVPLRAVWQIGSGRRPARLVLLLLVRRAADELEPEPVARP